MCKHPHDWLQPLVRAGCAYRANGMMMQQNKNQDKDHSRHDTTPTSDQNLHHVVISASTRNTRSDSSVVSDVVAERR
jgi:hypothetical protein